MKWAEPLVDDTEDSHFSFGLSEPIDVVAWLQDEEWTHYPEGTRTKSAYFPPAALAAHHDCIKKDRRYLFKLSDRRYPEQFWAEIAAYHIGCILGVDVPPAYPAINSATDTCAALIEWFYTDEEARFVSGGHYMQQLIPHFDSKHGQQHNFRDIRMLFRTFRYLRVIGRDWHASWVRMLLFDALCGNTDRHQDNWGLVFPRGEGGTEARLSPCYDNGTSLGYELWEEHQGKKWDDKRWLKYVSAGTHHMRWTRDAPCQLGHVQFIGKLATLFPDQRAAMLRSLESFDLGALRATLSRFCAIDSPAALTEWRADLMHKLVALRREHLLEELQ